MDRAQWIRSQPFSVPASALVAKAKKLGMRITVQYVRNVRSIAKMRERIAARRASGDESIDPRVRVGRKNYRLDAKWAAYGKLSD